jgi:hypothetical protein
MKIFGRNKGKNYFGPAKIKPHIYRRIISGIHRGTGGRKDYSDPFTATIR